MSAPPSRDRGSSDRASREPPPQPTRQRLGASVRLQPLGGIGLIYRFHEPDGIEVWGITPEGEILSR